MNKTFSTIALVIILLLLGVVIYMYFNPRTVVQDRVVKDIRRDTTTKIEQDTIVMHTKATKLRVVYDTIRVHDTVERISIAQIEAALDTILKEDTLYVAYYYPQNTFDMILKKRPCISQTIEIVREIEKKKEFYEQPWFNYTIGAIGGLFVGYQFGQWSNK